MRARRTSAERTRGKIVRAARALLSARTGIGAFTIDAVARTAGVARMTVYHQFGSKTDLIEAVFDSLVIVRTGVPRLVAALGARDPRKTLAAFVSIFAGVWQADRPVIRRLQGLAAIDPEFARVWRRREERRREGLRIIVSRIGARRTRRSKAGDEDLLTDVLYALIAFETYDAAAGLGRQLEAVAPLIHRLALRALAWR